MAITVFTENNTISSVGNYRILSFASPYTNVTGIATYSDNITGGSTEALISRFFRWSLDNISWSLWIEFTLADISPITDVIVTADDKFYVEFKIMAINDPTNSPDLPNGTPIVPDFVINSVTITVNSVAIDPYQDYVPQTLCSNEFCAIPIIKQDHFLFNPYAVNNALCLYKELSSMVNGLFGHEVVYWRVNPQARSADVVFKEWTLFQVEQQKCVKVLVPNNEFPDSKPQYNQFGMDFEIPFEIHIDKGYWESLFGKGSLPQQRDILYFPLLNRIYEVQSTYVYRDFMQQALYFKAQLVKYQPRIDTLLPTNIAEDLDNLTVDTDELFEEAMEQEIKRIAKPDQYVTITHSQDPVRYQVNRSLPIVKQDMYNNWVLIAENYYALDTLYAADGDVDSVLYRAKSKMGSKDGRAITVWFNPKVGSTPGNVRNIITGRNSSNQGMDVDLIFSTTVSQSAIRITINSATYLILLTDITLVSDKWYALVINVSNQFAQAGVNIWESQAGTSELVPVFEKIIAITPSAFDTEDPWKIKASPIWLTNIRIFDRMLELEHQSLVLTQLVVKDSDKSILIDNARPLLRLARVTNPK